MTTTRSNVTPLKRKHADTAPDSAFDPEAYYHKLVSALSESEGEKPDNNTRINLTRGLYRSLHGMAACALVVSLRTLELQTQKLQSEIESLRKELQASKLANGGVHDERN